MQTKARVKSIDSESLLAPPQPWARLAYGATLILAITGVFTCWCDTPMIWDGAYQFCYSLIEQRPYFYLTRFHSYILWLPLVWISHVTSNLTILKMTYGLPFTLAPAFSVLMSWWVVKQRAPHLVLWAIFGAAAGPLPGQIFIINDSIFQQHMFWPVFLGMIVELDWRRILVLSMLVVFQFSHQIGVVLLSGGAGAALLLAYRQPFGRTQFIVKSIIGFLLAAVALKKIIAFPDSYAQREFTWAAASNAWTWGVRGFPLRGDILMSLAGLSSLIALRHTHLRRWLWPLAGALILAAAVNWIIWAGSVHRWTTAANYRRWVVPLTMPFYILAFADVWMMRRPGDPREICCKMLAPLSIGYAVAGTFAVVLSIQSIEWIGLTRHLMADVSASPTAIVPWSKISWTADTALYHWGTASYVFVLEGQTPRHLVLDPLGKDSEAQLAMLRANPPLIPLSSFTPIQPSAGPAGWFDFWPMLREIRRELRL
jgi:hypothetical protein